MRDFFPQKVNNSYESGSSSSLSSSASSNEQSHNQSMQIEDLEGNKLVNLMSATCDIETLCYLSPEEDIDPAVTYQDFGDPNFQSGYNEYSDVPIVYSWLPIVPGFTQNILVHLSEKLPRCNSSDIPNQNDKYSDHLAINNSDQLHNRSLVEFHDLDNSGNAMDLNISCADKTGSDPDLSFNGKIEELKALDKNLEEQEAKEKEKTIEPEVEAQHTPGANETQPEDVNESKPEEVNESKLEEADEAKPQEADEAMPGEADDPKPKAEETEEERLHNESFELLKKEDGSKMILLNETSPELFEREGEVLSDNDAEMAHESAETVGPEERKNLDDCDKLVLSQLRSSIAGICPPSRAQFSLSAIVEKYKKYSIEDSNAKAQVKTNSLFLPTHSDRKVKDLEWPGVRSAKCLGVMYNKSKVDEEIDSLVLKFIDKYIGEETASSFNHRDGPSSAKKRADKLKLITKSPGSRLSHLAKRRKLFSSDSLKNTSLNASQSSGRIQSSLSASRVMMVDKSKLYAKSTKLQSPKRTLAKKTSGKKKTPSSAKRQLSSRISSKRALFTSPIENAAEMPSTSRDFRYNGPRRNLFDEIKRRSSTSTDGDAENRGPKKMRLESPTRMPKSQSFSIAGTSASSHMNESRFKKQLNFTRTQSEVFPQTIGNNAPLGYKKPLSTDVKTKMLCAIATALGKNGINNEHEKYTEYAKVLGKLLMAIFKEFYNPNNKSVTLQLERFVNFMTLRVVQEHSPHDILASTRSLLQSKNASRVTGYIGPKEYERNKPYLIQRNNSMLMMSHSSLSLNTLSSHHSETSLDGGTSSRLSDCCSSVSLSSSKNNAGSALRENFLGKSGETSALKVSLSDSNLNRSKSASSSSVNKAKRQISF